MDQIRVRFAPSPTGPLHIGGVRTALYNYLFAKKHQGTFILRIEDTDQTRYVEGAEEYFVDSLRWLGLEPDEGFGVGGEFGPYRQSERREIYREYAERLVREGHAYYAFDTPEELEAWREKMTEAGVHSPRYDMFTRMQMRNSLSLGMEESQKLIDAGTEYVIRLKVPEEETIGFSDIVRGEVQFRSAELDDKVMLKADGLPTYHLANIIDDHLMQISHVIRGEEWLSSTAHHVLLYRAFGWGEEIPQFAHLPLLLKPTGKGKLSKRDGAKFGFPVFPLDWRPENGEEDFAGFREFGFLPRATVNFLALLGWNPGDDRELMKLDELISLFSLEKIVKSGARFDIEKAKWFNQQYMLMAPDEELAVLLQPLAVSKGLRSELSFLTKLCELMKPRVNLLHELLSQSQYFFAFPVEYDVKQIKKKWKSPAKEAMQDIISLLAACDDFSAPVLEELIKSHIEAHQLGFGNILPLIRIAMTGTMQGPDVFETMALLGKTEVLNRFPAAFRVFDDILESIV